MKKSIAVFGLVLLSTLSVFSQISVDQSLTIEEYVNLLVGDGVNVSNISYTGSIQQIGYMAGGEGTIFPLSEGIALSTEVVGNITDPLDDVDNASIDTGDNAFGEPDLLTVANSVPGLIGQSFVVGDPEDVCILEFDFVAVGDFLSFNYSFGSDEYLAWVNTQYNDIFAFFLSGPGLSGPYASPPEFPDGAINIAQVPDSDPLLPITISSVNNNLNSEYYIDNPSPNADIDLNGFTTLIEASSPVICGETYHIKLAIADCGDQSLESVVFLESNSFTVQFTEVIASPTTDGSIYYNNDTILVEGCNTGLFQFTRGDTMDVDTVYFDVLGDTDPSDFVDSLSLPDFIVFDVGQDTVNIPIQAVVDTLNEPLEELTLYYSYIYDCTGDTIVTSSTIWLQDQIPPVLEAEDMEMYCSSLLIQPQIVQGDGPFWWNWGIVGDTITYENVTAIPVEFDTNYVETTYWVTVLDPCNYKDSTTITVTPLPIPPLILAPQPGVAACPGLETVIGVDVQSGASPYTYLWSNGSVGETITLFPEEDQMVSVIVDDACAQSDSIAIPVTVAQPDGPLTAQVASVSNPCPGMNTTLVVEPSGGYNADGYDYLWSTGATEDNITVAPEDLGLNEYPVQVIDNCGNVLDVVGTIVVSPPVPIELATDEELCIGFKTFLTQSGGTEPYSYTTTPEVSIHDMQIDGIEPGLGTITVEDLCGQSEEVNILIKACDTYIPNIFTPGAMDTLNATFVIKGIEEFPNSTLKVFNRWGNLVYKNSNYDNTWNASELAGGTYYYIFERSDEKNYSGYVEILK